MHLTTSTGALVAALLDPVRGVIERGLAGSALALGAPSVALAGQVEAGASGEALARRPAWAAVVRPGLEPRPSAIGRIDAPGDGSHAAIDRIREGAAQHAAPGEARNGPTATPTAPSAARTSSNASSASGSGGSSPSAASASEAPHAGAGAPDLAGVAIDAAGSRPLDRSDLAPPVVVQPFARPEPSVQVGTVATANLGPAPPTESLSASSPAGGSGVSVERGAPTPRLEFAGPGSRPVAAVPLEASSRPAVSLPIDVASRSTAPAPLDDGSRPAAAVPLDDGSRPAAAVPAAAVPTGSLAAGHSTSPKSRGVMVRPLVAAVRPSGPSLAPGPGTPPGREDMQAAERLSQALRPTLDHAAAITDAALCAPQEPRVANHFAVHVQLGTRVGAVDPESVEAALIDMLREAARRHGLEV